MDEEAGEESAIEPQSSSTTQTDHGDSQSQPLIGTGESSATPTQPQQPSFPSERLKRAAHMLFFKRGRVPGAKSWELKASLGKSYEKVLEQLDEELKELDLQVKKVETGGIGEYSPDEDEADKFRYLVRLRGTLTPKEARMSGWRIDNLAALAAGLALVVSKQGKVERKEFEAIISEKVGRWRTLTMTDTFLRTGYFEEDESGVITLGWRTKAEIDLPSLMMLIAEAKPLDFAQTEPQSDPGGSEAVEQGESYEDKSSPEPSKDQSPAG